MPRVQVKGLARGEEVARSGLMRYDFPFSFWDDGSEYVPADVYAEALGALKGLLRHSEKVTKLYLEDYDSPQFLKLIKAAQKVEERSGTVL